MKAEGCIIVIDDSSSMLDLVSEWLKGYGLCVVCFENGTKAMEHLSNSKVALIITDVYMPDMDGMEVLRYLRKTHPEIPRIVMSSAQGDFNCFNVAKAFGVKKTLQKPFGQAHLVEAVNEALNVS